MPLSRLEQPPLGTGERPFEIDRLKPIRPIFDRCSVGLGGLLVRTQNWLTHVSRVKLEPRLPGSVNSLLAANPHDIGSVTIDDLGGVFADKHGGDLRRIRCHMGKMRLILADTAIWGLLAVPSTSSQMVLLAIAGG